jgi:hypothetical protein
LPVRNSTTTFFGTSTSGPDDIQNSTHF